MQLNELPLADQLPLKLGALYEKYGYRKFKMSKFEPYDLYRENKNFLNTEGIITFTNSDGKLMAMKPDVTMSIVKNIKKDASYKKLYYFENVFRTTPESKELREIKQMGLEYIGDGSGYSEAEVLNLAIKTLETISDDYIINISHTAFVSSFLSAVCADEVLSKRIYKAIKQKNSAELFAVEREYSLDAKFSGLLNEMALYNADINTAVKEIGKYAFDDRANAAVSELKVLADTFALYGQDRRIRVDFSVIEDTDYYAGVIFNGYVQNIPRAVLTGGRYDNLMRRFNKSQGAIGFALYLGELDRALHKIDYYDAQAKLIYRNVPSGKVLAAVENLLQREKSVIAVKEDDNAIRTEKIYVLDESGSMEIIK